MEGGLGKSLIDGIWSGDGSDAAIQKAIETGNATLGMPAFRSTLEPDRLRALVIFIRERETAARLAGNPPPRPLPDRPIETRRQRYRLEPVIAKGIRTPWSIAFLPDGRKLVTEFTGALRVVDATGQLLKEPVQDVPASVCHGQGGMLDVAPHPGWATNGWIYLCFSEGENAPTRANVITAVSRGRLDGNRWVDHEWIYRADPKFRSGRGQHFGSRMVFRDGYIFFVVGERGGWEEAQDITRPNGKIFRLFDDGRVPPDNPFVADTNAIPGIWSYGHRNPQGLAFDPRTGDLYDTEHGPRGGDEFNLILPGRNYGWPVISHGMHYNGTPFTDITAKAGMEQPVIHWTPSIAPSGLDFYTGDKLPGWRGDAFAGSLRAEELHRLRVRNRKVVEQEIVLKGIGRIRDVVCGPDGYLYLALNGPDRIVRLVPAE